jgi:hypothetical protein
MPAVEENVREQPCPSCGAIGKGPNGEHATALRSGTKPGLGFVPIDVGWRCWKCGHEWGFEYDK